MLEHYLHRYQVRVTKVGQSARFVDQSIVRGSNAWKPSPIVSCTSDFVPRTRIFNIYTSRSRFTTILMLKLDLGRYQVTLLLK